MCITSWWSCFFFTHQSECSIDMEELISSDDILQSSSVLTLICNTTTLLTGESAEVAKLQWIYPKYLSLKQKLIFCILYQNWYFLLLNYKIILFLISSLRINKLLQNFVLPVFLKGLISLDFLLILDLCKIKWTNLKYVIV